MPSYYRDPEAPTPNVPRRVGVTAVIERDGAFLVERGAETPAELEMLPVWPVHRPIRDAFLLRTATPVVE